MKRILLLSILITFIVVANVQSQTTKVSNNIENTLTKTATKELKGLLLDLDKKTALPYANIYILNTNKGFISNEKGQFSIDISGVNKNDTLRFQYIGYSTKNITLGQLDTSSVVFLKEEIFNLSEALVFGNAPNPESIVKKVLLYKDSNYIATTSKKQCFIREREIADINDFQLDCKKSTIPELDEKMVALFVEKMPKNTTSYTDFLGYFYYNKNKNDSIRYKLEAIRTVSLKEKDISDLKQFETIFENVINNTKEKEYWKVKSGVFGGKVDENEIDTVPKKDTATENRKSLASYHNSVRNQLSYSLLNDKAQWEFLHRTGRYEYTLVGGTRVNGEDVYIIDFTPKNGGRYEGRLFISINTFALIRADYEYAQGKTGRDFHLLGIGFTETQFSGSIYFEKKNDNYLLKYFSNKSANKITLDRNFSLIKKRKRLLLDKTLNEIKVGFKISVNTEESFEYLVLQDKEITNKQFADFKPTKYLDVIYVDQFDDKLWSGFPIIEPTKQMKEYKKQKVNYTN